MFHCCQAHQTSVTTRHIFIVDLGVIAMFR